MLHALKRLFSGAGSAWTGPREWAQARGLELRPTREGHGFVVESGNRQTGWRLEWGPSQRPYIEGGELRLRGETPEVELQMLILSRSLMDAMERAVFEQYTEGLQTRIDTQTPEEMRWLVLFPKAPESQLKILRDSFSAMASSPHWLQSWFEGPLTEQLQQARSSWLAEGEPLALVYQRGRLTMRLSAPEPDAARMTAAVALYEVALREARRVAADCLAQGGPVARARSGGDAPPADDSPTVV